MYRTFSITFRICTAFYIGLCDTAQLYTGLWLVFCAFPKPLDLAADILGLEVLCHDKKVENGGRGEDLGQN